VPLLPRRDFGQAYMISKSIRYVHHMPRVMALTMGKSGSSLGLGDGEVWYNGRQAPKRRGGGHGMVIPARLGEINARLEVKCTRAFVSGTADRRS
jgi:hypothetical protein